MTEDDLILAGELALGLLEGAERADALRRRIADPAFAREVARWEERLAGLYAAWPEAEPSDAVRRRIVDGAPASPRAAASHASRRWQWTAGLASLAAAVLLVLLLARPPAPPLPVPAVNPAPVPAPAPLVAVMTPKGGEPFGAVFDAARREVRLGGIVAVPPGRVAELWAIGADGVPHAAGLLAAATRRPLAVAAAIIIAPGTTLAISIEPAGGSPQSTPTGPVVATGKLAEA